MVAGRFKLSVSQLSKSRVKSSLFSTTFVEIPGQEYGWLVCVTLSTFPESLPQAMGVGFYSAWFGWQMSPRGQEAG